MKNREIETLSAIREAVNEILLSSGTGKRFDDINMRLLLLVDMIDDVIDNRVSENTIKDALDMIKNDKFIASKFPLPFTPPDK